MDRRSPRMMEGRDGFCFSQLIHSLPPLPLIINFSTGKVRGKPSNYIFKSKNYVAKTETNTALLP